MSQYLESLLNIFLSQGKIVSVLLVLSIVPLLSMSTVTNFQQHVAAQGQVQCISIRPNETSVAGPSPSPNVISNLPPEVGRGFSNISDLTKLTGDNFAILLNNKDISNPSLTIAEGLERAQLGGDIPGKQGTIFEGEMLRNVTSLCWQK